MGKIIVLCYSYGNVSRLFALAHFFFKNYKKIGLTLTF